MTLSIESDKVHSSGANNIMQQLYFANKTYSEKLTSRSKVRNGTLRLKYRDIDT